ncbi:MAG: DUF1573 domain-containing protein [Flavobacteriales bacterium]|nr:DUF1573 domain-containing protein [Flavobacteriales bacterium]
MKRILMSAMIAASLFLAACGGGASTEGGETEITTDNVESTTTIEFESDVFDFGSITQGEKVTHSFFFTNTGDADLVIVSAKGSCGCTVPEWPKEPIEAGAQGEIKVVFNSEGKKGKQHKRVSIIANSEPATSAVTLKGDVIVPIAEGMEEVEPVQEPAVEGSEEN